MTQHPVYVSESTGSEHFWQEGNLIFTNGVKSMCEELQAYWIINVIISYFIQLHLYSFLIIYFDVFEDQTCYFHVREDSDLSDIVSQHIDYTDLKLSICMYLTDSILLMREEY